MRVENYCLNVYPVNKLYFLRAPAREENNLNIKQLMTQEIRLKIFCMPIVLFKREKSMSVTIQGNTSTVISNNSAPGRNIRNSQNHKTNSGADWKSLGKISSEEGWRHSRKKEMAALVQKQIESLWAQLEQLLRQQAEKKNEDATVQPDKRREKDDTNTAGTIDIYV